MVEAFKGVKFFFFFNIDYYIETTILICFHEYVEQTPGYAHPWNPCIDRIFIFSRITLLNFFLCWFLQYNEAKKNLQEYDFSIATSWPACEVTNDDLQVLRVKVIFDFFLTARLKRSGQVRQASAWCRG